MKALVGIGWAALVIAVGAVAACSPEGSAEQGCEAPHVLVAPATVSPGDEVTIRGTAMVDGCADAIEMDEDGKVISHETQSPLASLEVVYRAQDMERVLAAVDADERGSFEIMVRIPQESPPGHAEVSVGPVWPEWAELEIVPGR
jgi:hypothetical protein